MMSMELLLAIVGTLIGFIVGILCYFMQGILHEMKILNEKLITTVSNQEWHYKAITELQVKVLELERKC